MRRTFESVLKIECAYREIRPEREYPELKLGDVVKALKDNGAGNDRQKLNRIVRVLNEYSHDSGFPVIKSDLLQVSTSVVQYTRQLYAEVERKLKRAA